MRNQVQAAKKLELRARMIVGDTYRQWKKFHQELRGNEVDLLMVSPERLAKQRFIHGTLPLIKHNLGLLIIDEAHCISDWGHDFRPDYRRIKRVQAAIPPNVPIVATTATANDRVVKDVREQLGASIMVSQGSLVRKSLRLQNVILPDANDTNRRLAWLGQVIPQLKGSGIVYTLTRKDSSLVADWLKSLRIKAQAYHGSIGHGYNTREVLEQKLLNNELKVLVATVALGMGFDKPDLGFVIHYQRPSSVVHYYQQVGRAGRGIDKAYGLLLSGSEDDPIAEHFMDSAFPPPEMIKRILTALNNSWSGLTVDELLTEVNLSSSNIADTLKLLAVESPAPVLLDGKKWASREENTDYQIDPDYIARLRDIRKREQIQMQKYMRHRGCLMMFLQRALDDETEAACGRCCNCIGQNLVPVEVPHEAVHRANVFVLRRRRPISVRRKWPISNLSDHDIHSKERRHIPYEYRALEGKALSEWCDGHWGSVVSRERKTASRYSSRLIKAVYKMIERWRPNPFPEWITIVPPRRPTRHVHDLAHALAARLGLPYIPAVERIRENRPQSEMKNDIQRAANVANVFKVSDKCKEKRHVLLVDDLSVSGWTFATVSALLKYSGCETVRPMALAKRNMAS